MWFDYQFPKTKLLVVGTGITEANMAPSRNVSSVIESVPSFRYLGSIVESRCSDTRC